MRIRGLLILAALPVIGACSIMDIGGATDEAADVPVIEHTANICRTLTTDQRSVPVVGRAVPVNAPTESPTGSHSCRWPAVTTPIRAEIVVEVTVNEKPAESAAREQFTSFVSSHTCVKGYSTDQRTCVAASDIESNRSLGRIPYGDFACVGAWDHLDVAYLGIMKEGNVITVVSIRTRRQVSAEKLRPLAADLRGPLRTLMRVADSAINRPPSVARDPSGDLPRPLPQAKREVAPDWSARECREKLAPPVFN
jgi:hypothetical protein